MDVSPLTPKRWCLVVLNKQETLNTSRGKMSLGETSRGRTDEGLKRPVTLSTVASVKSLLAYTCMTALFVGNN